MKDNRGFSLIELIVVIAILAVVAVFGIAGLGYVFGTNARACANKLYTAVGRTRITTMGKEETALRIYRDGATGPYYKQELIDGVAGNPEEVGKATLVLTYTVKDDTTPIAIDGTQELVIAFDRGSGSERVATVSDGTNDHTSVLCERIEVTGGGRTYSLGIVPATGKIIKD